MSALASEEKERVHFDLEMSPEADKLLEDLARKLGRSKGEVIKLAVVLFNQWVAKELEIQLKDKPQQ